MTPKGMGFRRGRPIVPLGVASLLLMVAVMAGAATNLNSSRSNIYRLVYPADVVSSAQATAILAELDKAGRVDEARLRRLLQQILPKHGVAAGRIQKVIVRPWDPKRKSMSVILLTDPADEPQALAVSDEGVPADKATPKKGGSK